MMTTIPAGPGLATRDDGRLGILLLSMAVLVLALAPIAATPYLPILDGASHEARLVALRQLLTGAGSPFYTLDTLFLANMGFDLVGVGLLEWFSPQMAGRVFQAATTVLTFTGIMALNRVAAGAWRAWPLVTALLLYNLFTLLGFFGYELGVGLLFWALAGRLLLVGRPVLARFAAGSVAGVVLLFCHVSAFGIYAVMLAGMGLEALWRARSALGQVLLMGAELVPACVLYGLMVSGGHEPPRYEWPYWRSKIFSAIDTVTSGSVAGDAAFLVGAAAVGLLLVLGRVRVHRPLAPGLVLLVLLYFAIPGHVSGGSYVDTRLPVVIVLLALASCRVEMRWARAGAALLAVAGAAFVVKQVALTVLWSAEGRALSEIAAVFERLPRGAVVFQSECYPDPYDVPAVYVSRQPPVQHVAGMAAFGGDRFAAVSWTLKGQQPIQTAAAYRPFKDYQDGLSNKTCSQAEYRGVLEGARRVTAHQVATGGITPPLFLLLLRPHAPGLLAEDAELVGRTDHVELYAVQ